MADFVMKGKYVDLFCNECERHLPKGMVVDIFIKDEKDASSNHVIYTVHYGEQYWKGRPGRKIKPNDKKEKKMLKKIRKAIKKKLL